ncbi:substrate-binding domain-containing protein [Oceanidesulfovibrio marinus]|uniref:ABC transporter substrate-binding protein n=1 Tax=Oceanidesulfovibrio marinus TaxID=370038 RepID=A0A6P1ZGX9_9BACT|nr:substrate-binding domain-containing protein [Oceanidesulfovibrio marinus]QJT10338.1 ABC transporter substrate-binding protein [Oceanidesulfovibrio marinus]TVM32291.1 ABC transporter substrate-binding protein [Oceanidesulfovibrio marinus]
MRRLLLLLVFVCLIAAPAYAKDCTAVYGDSDQQFKLATGSPGELGLLEQLANAFNADHDTSLCWIKAGSGASLKLLKEKEVDAVMVHAPAAEKKAVEEGWATDRKLIGSNEFYIVGPESDPADIADAESVADAYARIAKAKALFFSRGDNSGTHKKEMAIWEKAGIEPSGDWYVVTKDFMMATLKRADAEKGYFMTDSSTYVAARKELQNVKPLFSGDPFIVNTYHGLCQPAGATPMAETGCEFIDFVGSDAGQQIIRDFGKDRYGEPLYNDAEYAKQFVH